MAKNTTKKIKELKKEKPSKITNEELNQVQSVINDMNRAQIEIGSMETKKHSLLHHISTLQERLSIMQSEFEKTYGTADINIQDGTINHKKNEQTN
jgi:fumarate hydratase class II